MLWFFERHRARLHYEIRRQSDGPAYELVIRFPDGGENVERFPDADAVVQRSADLQNRLMEAGWAPPRLNPRARSAPRRYGAA